MIQRIRHSLAALTPQQATIVGLLFIASAILAGIALWGFTTLNQRRQII